MYGGHWVCHNHNITDTDRYHNEQLVALSIFPMDTRARAFQPNLLLWWKLRRCHVFRGAE